MKKFLINLFKEGKIKFIEPSEEIFNSYLEKSISNLESAKILFQKGKLEEVISLSYYSSYNLVLALLFKMGVKSENHSGTIILLKEIFGIENEFLFESKNERIDKQYYVGFKITKDEVKNNLILTENFNRDLKGFIHGIGRLEILKYQNKLKEVLE